MSGEFFSGERPRTESISDVQGLDCTDAKRFPSVHSEHSNPLNVQRTPPTLRQIETLRFIAEHVADHDCPPPLRVICAKFGLRSSYAATCRLRKLIRRGWITPNDLGKHRAYSVTERGHEALGGRPIGQAERLAAITGYVDPPTMRCPECARVLFRAAHQGHRCLSEDVACVRGAA